MRSASQERPDRDDPPHAAVLGHVEERLRAGAGSLFSSTSETVLVDDERGRIAYTPGFLPAEVARAWFAELRESVPWKTQRRRMYDREVDVPRLMAHFRLEPEERHVPHYTHGIPKTREPVGARISLAFRVKPAREPAEEERFYR